MTKWILLPLEYNFSNNWSFHERINNYNFYANYAPKDLWIDKNNKCFVLIDGFIIPRVNSKFNDLSLKNVFEKYKKYGKEFIKGIKGNYNLIIRDENKLTLFSDYFGIIKFLYFEDSSEFFASNDFNQLKKYKQLELNNNNVITYNLFNYNLSGKTFFNNLFYSKGSEIIEIDEKIVKTKYYDFKELVRPNKDKYGNRSSYYKVSSELWLEILGSYKNKLNIDNLSLTLTAGLDSRMILSGMKALNWEPFTFTFGDSKSKDVIYAKNIALNEKLNYLNITYEDDFYKNYPSFVDNLFSVGNSITTAYRTHRYYSYSKLSQKTDFVFLGMAGSEILRSFYPDNLIVSSFVQSIWKNSVNEDYLIRYLSSNDLFSPKFIKDLNSELINYILNIARIPGIYLLEEIIPMHFGMDIRLLNKIGIDSCSPYMDIDFIEYISETPFFIGNKDISLNYKTNSFNRMDEPSFSCNIINILDKNLAEYQTGKGYSPKDYCRSKYYSGTRFILDKYWSNKDKSQPNFAYDDWYKKYLTDYFNDDTNNFDLFDKDMLLKNLNSISGNDELSYLEFTKLLNLSMCLEKF